MDLTNRLLRRINDVEISESDFLSVRGIQAVAKDCVLDTIREINSSRIDWPFNAVEHSQSLVAGTEEYAWPLQFTAADWDSFQIQKDDDLNVNHTQLTAISREEWYHNYRDMDYDSESLGRGVPTFVFPSHGQGWGVTPSPNQAYAIKYRYYKNPDDLVDFDDETTIPSKFDYVILAGSLQHMNLFKENPNGVAIAQKKFKDGVSDMVNLYLPNPIYAYDTRVNFGGGVPGGGYLFYKGGL
jgi:hypothetical protein